MQCFSVNALPNVGRVEGGNTRAYWLNYCNKIIFINHVSAVNKKPRDLGNYYTTIVITSHVI